MRGSPFSSWFSLSDELAMLRVQKHGDPRAFALLVRRWERPIQRLCTRMTGDRHRGEDLTQETFMRLFAKRKAYRHEARLSTFLRRIALNLCYDAGRRAKGRSQSLVRCQDSDDLSACAAAAACEPAPDVLLEKQERADLVRRALLRMPEHYRSVVVLRHYEGLKFREVAQILEIPEGTVKSRMAEALARLARLLRPKLKEDEPR